MAENNQAANEGVRIAPSPEFAGRAHLKKFEDYQAMYDRSVRDPEGFWAEMAEQFEWKQKWTKVREYSLEPPVSIQWFLGGKTNLSVNCLDRHLAKRGNQTAILWEGNVPRSCWG